MPFTYTVAFFNLKISGLSTDPEDYKGSMYVYLKEQCGQIITGSDTVIEARAANKEVATKLDLTRNTPLLVLYQQHHNQEGDILVYSIDYFVHNLLLKVKRRSSGFFDYSTP